MKEKPTLQMGIDKIILRQSFMVEFSDRGEWRSRFQPNRNGQLVSRRRVPRQMKAMGPECMDIV
jgi:hypothetical protein